MEMALQFDIDVAVAENFDQALHAAEGTARSTLGERCGERTVVAAGETDETLGMLFEFGWENRAFVFLRAYLHFGDQAAEVLVAGGRGDEKGKAEVAVRLLFTRLFITTEARRHGEI